MKRVALVLVGSRRVNRRTCRFLEGLASSGFAPTVVAVPRRAWETSGVEQPELLARRGFVVASAGSNAAGVRLVVCMHWSVLPVALLVGAVCRAPVLYDEHDHYEVLALEASGPAWLNRVRSAVVALVHRVALPRVDLVTCIHLTDGSLRTHLARRASQVVELHNYPSRRWFGAAVSPEADANREVALVYLGGIWAEKGCGVAVDAFELLRADPAAPPCALHVFGQGDPTIEAKLRATPGVTFHGLASSDEILRLLASRPCVGLVLLDATPRYATVSTNCHKLFEYLAAGVPVVATDVGDLARIVGELDGGWVINPGYTPSELASLFASILSLPGEIRRRGAAASAAMDAQDLSWEHEWAGLEPLLPLMEPEVAPVGPALVQAPDQVPDQ